MDTNPKTSVIRQKDALSRFKSASGELLDNLLTLADDKLKAPFELSLSSTVLTIASSEVQLLESDGSDGTQNTNKKAIQPEKGLYNVVAQSTIDFSNGAGTGDMSTGSLNIDVTVPASEYVYMGLEKRPDNKLYLTWGTPNAVAGSATYPVFGSGSGFKPICMVLLQDDGTGSSGTSWNFNTPTNSDFIVFESSGGGGGSGDSNSVWDAMLDELDSLPYEFLSGNIFAIDEDNKVDGSSTGTYDTANSSYDLATSEILITTNMLSTAFLNSELDISTARIKVVYDIDELDTNPAIQISRDGGNEYQNLNELVRITDTDTYIGKHTFSTESANQTLIEKPGGDATTTQELTASGNNQSLSQFFVDTAGEVVKKLTVYVTKTGSPSGQLIVKLVKDDSGDPSSDLSDVLAQKQIQVSDLLAGSQAIELTFDAVLIADDKYHVVFETDASYKSSFVTSTTVIAVNTDNTSVTELIKQYNGTVWADISSNQGVYKIEGRELDLRLKITASEASAIKGVGIYYGEEPNASAGSLKTQVFPVETSAGVKTLTVDNFVPDKDLLEVIIPSRGQIFRQDPSTFTISGKDLVFEEDFFKDLPAQTISVIVDQNRGTIYDGSDENRTVLAENHLGSQVSSLDKSVNGRGILLRNSTGTLVEVWVDGSNNIQISEVV
jgi:hypothetical protein